MYVLTIARWTAGGRAGGRLAGCAVAGTRAWVGRWGEVVGLGSVV